MRLSIRALSLIAVALLAGRAAPPPVPTPAPRPPTATIIPALLRQSLRTFTPTPTPRPIVVPIASTTLLVTERDVDVIAATIVPASSQIAYLIRELDRSPLRIPQPTATARPDIPTFGYVGRIFAADGTMITTERPDRTAPWPEASVQ